MDSRATRSSFRKYGFACLVCRRKKTRCGGEKPACQNCLKAGDECTYKPTDARVARLQAELAISQARVQELERTLKNLSLLDHADRDNLITEAVGDNATGMPPPGPDAEQGDFYPPDPSPANTANLGSSASLAGLTPDVGSHHSGLELPQLSINEHGEVMLPPHPAAWVKIQVQLLTGKARSFNMLAPHHDFTNIATHDLLPRPMPARHSSHTPMSTTTENGLPLKSDFKDPGRRLQVLA